SRTVRSPDGLDHTLVCLGRERDTGGRLSEEVLEDAGSLDVHEWSCLVESLALCISDGELHAVVRRRVHDTARQMYLYRRPADGSARSATEPETLFPEPANWGFDSHLFARPDGHPAVLHFAHG